MRRLLLLLLILGSLLPASSDAKGESPHLVWGTTAVNLGPAWANSPSLDALLADQQSTLSLKRFYRAGGENIPATPTECRVAYLDYTYDAAIKSHKTGIPLMRAMPVAYPYETALASIADEYMFGSQLLVAPVVDERDLRTISFPPGAWTSLWDGRVTTGPVKTQVPVALDTIPVYLKEGAVLLVRLNKDLQFGASMTGGRVSAVVVTPPREKGETSLANARTEPGRVSLLPRPNGLTVTLTNLPETLHLLVCGASVREVKADGEVLPKLPEAAFDSGLAGWRADPAALRVAVRLPPLKAQSAPSARIMELRLGIAPVSLPNRPSNGTGPAPSGAH